MLPNNQAAAAPSEYQFLSKSRNFTDRLGVLPKIFFSSEMLTKEYWVTTTRLASEHLLKFLKSPLKLGLQPRMNFQLPNDNCCHVCRF